MNLFLLTATLLFCFMTLVFLLALKLEDNSIVDIAYGLGFVLVGWSGSLAYGSGEARQLLLLVLISSWATSSTAWWNSGSLGFLALTAVMKVET